MTHIRKIPTGVPGLDVLLHGGIPQGRATLISGRSGTGKTVLGLQIAANLARAGFPAVVVAVEETAEDLTRSGDALGLDYSTLLSERKVAFADATHFDGRTVVAGEYDLEGLKHRLSALVHQIGARVIVLDSSTALFTPRPSEDELRSQFFQLISTMRTLDVTAIILSEAQHEYGQLTLLGVEDYVCDLTIVLRNIVDGSRRRRSIEVNKFRRSGHSKGEFPCTITSTGVNVMPLESRETPTEQQVERFSSGIAGLDEMTHGGWLRGSIIILRGPTGSGKTILAGLYARAGAVRAERVVYYGFEEPRALLLRNYRAMGMDLAPFIDTGHLRVICRYAEATSLEDLLVDLYTELGRFQPSLIVMDSLSSIEHSSSVKGFRQFMVGMTSILREHGRTALLTQTVARAEIVSQRSVPYLSTLADAILDLNYSMGGYELEREMRVLKMRGSSHELHPYRLSIEQGGIVASKLTQEAPAHVRARRAGG
jgi:circadian clock protein KaiC